MSTSIQSRLSGKWRSTPEAPPLICGPGECFERPGKQLTIGLVNNMPDSALEAAEHQFTSLLSSASKDFSVRLRLYNIPDIPRGASASARISRNYAGVDQMFRDRPDALIVTGREPHSTDLRHEPYWSTLVRVLEWARENTCSTVWSCLAAHAAVLHMDGIKRVRSDCKHSGVFECTRIADHALTSGMPDTFRLPHSRWNGLKEDELVARGYTILSRAKQAGVDTFIKQDKSLFVFFQGHPEYGSLTLLLEYRRDIRRYLHGETTAYPTLPQGCVNERAAAALLGIEHEAHLCPREELLEQVSDVLQQVSLSYSWQTTATRIYTNWLHYLAMEKELQTLRTGLS